MSSSRYVGRHGSTRRSRLPLPSLGGAKVGRTAAKSVAGVGVVLGCGAVVVAPTPAIGTVDARSALGVQQSSATEQLAERDADSSSRSAERGSPDAVSAPIATKGAGQGSASVDVEAIAEPKPKREPVEEGEDEAQDRDEEEADEESDSSDDESTEPSASSTTSPDESRSSESSDSRSSSPSTASSSPSSTSTSNSSSSSSSSSPKTGSYRSKAAGLGLGPNAQDVYSAVRTQFPDMTNIGGYRAGDPGDHGSGKAVDIMVTGSRGDQVAAWLQQNAGRLNITYIIWKQRIWHPGGSWESMSDRGDATQNHFDHVHVSVS